MALSPSGSSRRVAVQAMACLVDGCTADLNECRKYYQRHKVCEFHSKSPQVSINGQVLRFCQQCSRFHSLEEFDEGKRSCRKRLDGHNRRRRKPRQYLYSTTRGTDALQPAAEQVVVHPTMARANPLWGGVAEAPAWMDHLNTTHSLLSSPVAPQQVYTSAMSHVVHPPPDFGLFAITASSLDQGPGYRGMNSMDPCHNAFVDHDDPLNLPYYWRS